MCYDLAVDGCRDVMQGLVEQWAKVAVSHAVTESIKDPDGMVATIVGIDGPWAFGQTEKEAIKAVVASPAPALLRTEPQPEPVRLRPGLMSFFFGLCYI